MNTARAVPCLLILLAAAVAAQPPAKKKGKADADAETPAAEAPAETAKAAPADDGKKRVEGYLASRTKKLQDAHALRLEFASHENFMWEDFWGKVRDARKTFELRMARQTLDLFSALETLDPKDHDATLADFEKMRGNMVKAFESQQKQKMAEFFAQREARWKQFADIQERDRTGFAAEADAAWQDNKSFLKSLYSPPAPKKS